MNRNTIIGFIIAAAVVVGIIWAGRGDRPQNLPLEFKEFENNDLGISFRYPDRYFVNEQDLSTEEREVHAIVLTPVDAEIPVDGEGPPTITFELTTNETGQPRAKTMSQSTGLYEFDNVEWATARWNIKASAAWLTSSDLTRSDLQTVLASLKITEPDGTNTQAF